MPTLRSQTAKESSGSPTLKPQAVSAMAEEVNEHTSLRPRKSLKEKREVVSDFNSLILPSTSRANASSYFPLGPSTPVRDHEMSRSSASPILRRSRRLNVDLDINPTGPSSASAGRLTEGKRKVGSVGEELASIESLSVVPRPSTEGNVDVASHNNASVNKTNLTGARRSLRKRGRNEDSKDSDPSFAKDTSIASASQTTMIEENDESQLALQVVVRVDSNPVENENVTRMVVEDAHPNQEEEINNQGSILELDNARSLKFRRTESQHVGGSRAEAARSRFLRVARKRAFHFAHFNAEVDEAPAGSSPPAGEHQQFGNNNQVQLEPQKVDWPGPFSTARQLVKNRETAAAARKESAIPGEKSSLVDWRPSRDPSDTSIFRRKPSSLQDICLGILAKNAESVVSLDGVPDTVRARISAAFCERRTMSATTLSLFFQGMPSEIHCLDCTQICEDKLTELMKQVCPMRLEKLHLEYCGRGLTEQCLLSSIASSTSVTSLKSVSLKGAYRLSDKGLEVLLQATPQLVHLDLSSCSFLTNDAVKALAKLVNETLESLVLDGCRNLDATKFVLDIVQLTKLQKLSFSEVRGVTDEVISEICVRLGANLKELILDRCTSLSDSAVAAIGACCPSLQVLNTSHIPKLTDVSIAHITDNLRKLQNLSVRRCQFSDEAIAAFVTASGSSLLRLSLNSMQQIAGQTVLALTRYCHSSLEYLDLSFCRLLDDECLGLLADSCLQLKELRLYGCTQVTNKFLNGHSNSNLKVIGLKQST
ncbi:hypothetical protein KP509_06G067100 [Ceratopteris richardii]|uniref:F-box/LRR-repeat protein 15-like leucin rich repeat domain-containing protein n=1 Tax=Ceratopteris richardii TaxID=49495 RepID=A0A8T2UNX2_CERRI|nr:hypothetical protein KP509_06G067100 [Ceratopteris richardii]KAH7435494.1 hypothetical protein KP509_06G067100 [Ceratopteris richardii]